VRFCTDRIFSGKNSFWHNENEQTLPNEGKYAQQRAKAKNGHWGEKNAILWPNVRSRVKQRLASQRPIS
jgi:hypothetical protein